jgi:HEAT repeat protein
VFVAPSSRCESTTPAGAAPQATLLETLKSDAPLDKKADACRQLAQVGTREAVPALAALLSHEKLAHRARMALEAIPDPAADEALRAALPNVKGRLLVGVLYSIGFRRDAKAAEVVAPFLQDEDAEVAGAAATALGKIGGATSAKALQNAIGSAPDAVKPAVWDGVLLCAEALIAQGQQKEAIALYDALRAAETPFQFRVAATRGAILARKSDGIPMLVEIVNGQNATMFNLALQLVLEFPGQDGTRALAEQAGRLPPQRQALLVQALGSRGDRAALPEIRTAAKHEDLGIRTAAIRALAQLGDASSLALLVDAAASSDKSVAEAAVAAIVRLPAGDVDSALLELARGKDAAKSATAIDCLARRRVATAAPGLLKLAAEGDAQVKVAALRALSTLAKPADIPPLLSLFLRAEDTTQREAAERALIDACVNAADPACAEKVAEPLAQAKPEQKLALIRVLNAIGGPKALQAIRESCKDANAEIQDAAVGALSNWATPDAAPELLALAKSSEKANHKVLALRGFIRLAYDGSLSAENRLAMCRDAAPLIQRDDEKRQLLGALGGIPSAEALKLIVPHLENAGVKEEAALAAITLAGKLLKSPEAKASAALIAEAMEKVKQQSKNAGTVEAAGRHLERAKQLEK